MSTELQKNVTDLVDVCHRIYDKGFVSATDGNVSARLENGNILATPTAINKGMVKPDDLVIVDLEGNLVSGLKRPSTPTLLMQLALQLHASRLLNVSSQKSSSALVQSRLRHMRHRRRKKS
jgi:ribulose-5-phosphate 4-epimerase/fuculose-1-phosphate aldolase